MRLFRPRSSLGLAGRFLVLTIVVIGAVAATTAVAGLLQVQNLANDFGIHTAIKSKAIKVPAAGAPQTILLIGSDHRAGTSFKTANTDTMLLLRLNGSSSTINVMSLPRDLEVTIPGAGTNPQKLNAAYSEGGWNLLIKTIKQNVFPQFVPNHILDVNFGGFADLVDAIGCVYSDIDHRYYNQSEPAPSPDNFSSIDLEPGYQRLCGGNNQPNGALAFVRFRHTDTDLVREARQQDFIRWAKSQYSIGSLVSNRDRLLKILGEHSQSDEGLHSIDGLLKLFDLAANMESNGASIKQIPFPATLQPCTATACFVTSTTGQEQATWAQFIHATPAGSSKSQVRKTAHNQTRARRAPSTAGLVDDVSDGQAQAQALSRAGMPVYFPRLVMPSASSANPYCSALLANCNDGDEPSAVYTHAYPRQYTIVGPDGTHYHAYRMTLTTNYLLDTFYGVQGTTWNDPPLLSSPSGTRIVKGRKLFLYKDGSKLTTVAWHHDGDAYWISNTLTEDLTNSQMVSIAASLMR
jgi:polyisoprenyl-teichoic acid--peptidoglycan teichoic acid transferase